MRSNCVVKTESIPNTIRPMDEQLKWREKSKLELIATSRINMMKRLTKIINKVNHHHQLLNQFEMKKEDIRRMFNDVDNAIRSWRGVDITSCKKQKDSFKQYKVTATNWFNRNKAKIYGNYFFCPLMFNYLLNHCRELKGPSMSNRTRMEIFISLFLMIFGGKITFARTKAQPLMPYQTLIQPNQFRNKCKELVSFYDLEWNQSAISPSKVHRIYQKDKCRSHKIFASFIKCLKSIQHTLSSPKGDTYTFFKINCIDMRTVKHHEDDSNSMETVSNTSAQTPPNIVTPLYTPPLYNNGLSFEMNQMINNVLSAPSDINNNNNNHHNMAPTIHGIHGILPNMRNNNNMMQINNLNINGNCLVNNVNIPTNNGIRVRYQLLSIHPHLPPIIISQNVL